ncbi:MAG: hypothetical protein GY842_01975, partial [bacterium]|nr:hypothetical protein [bacterium]
GGSFSVSTLSEDIHSITAEVTDSDGELGSDSITVRIDPPTAPVVSITSPPDGGAFSQGWPLTFTATANDNIDGDLSKDILWTSNRDGFLDTGGSFTGLLTTLGVHTITARVTDSDHIEGSDTIEVTIHDQLDPRYYEVGIVTGDSYSIFGGRNPMSWVIATVAVGGMIFNEQIPNMVVEAADALDYVAGWHQLAVPVLQGQEFELVAMDMTTGYEIFRDTLAPQTDEVVMLPPSEWGDNAPPWPRAGDPLRFFMLETSPGTRDIAAGISMEMTTDSLTVSFAQGALGINAAAPEEERRREVRIFSLPDGSVETWTISEDAPIDVSRTVNPGEP